MIQNSPPYRKKLIEVALPLEAINRASAREKSIRYGHPSTLHLWWARWPLAVCRAVIFSTLFSLIRYPFLMAVNGVLLRSLWISAEIDSSQPVQRGVSYGIAGWDRLLPDVYDMDRLKISISQHLGGCPRMRDVVFWPFILEFNSNFTLELSSNFYWLSDWICSRTAS